MKRFRLLYLCLFLFFSLFIKNIAIAGFVPEIFYSSGNISIIDNLDMQGYYLYDSTGSLMCNDDFIVTGTSDLQNSIINTSANNSGHVKIDDILETSDLIYTSGSISPGSDGFLYFGEFGTNKAYISSPSSTSLRLGDGASPSSDIILNYASDILNVFQGNGTTYANLRVGDTIVKDGAFAIDNSLTRAVLTVDGTGVDAYHSLIRVRDHDTSFRGAGFMSESVEEGSEQSWFIGKPYTSAGFMIGYAPQKLLNNSGDAFYLAQSKVFFNPNGNIGIGTTSTPGRLTLSGQQQTLKGTEAAPAYSFISDADTGMFSSNADAVNLVTGGTTRVKIGNDYVSLAGTAVSDTVGAVTISDDLSVTGQEQVAKGSFAAPAYSFIGDSDTGIYSSAADTLNFVTFGSTKAILDANGNLGIGATSPYKLTVSGVSNLQNSIINSTSNNNGDVALNDGVVISGKIGEPIKAISFANSPYTVTDTDVTLLCDATNGNVTINLPTLSSSYLGSMDSGRKLLIKKIDGNPATSCIIDGFSSETVDFNLTASISNIFESITIQAIYDGVYDGWYRVGENLTGPFIAVESQVAASFGTTSQSPPIVVVDDVWVCRQFVQSQTGQKIYLNTSSMDNWDEQSDFYLSFNWRPATGDPVADGEVVKWNLRYRAITIGDPSNQGALVSNAVIHTQVGAGIEKETYNTIAVIDYDNTTQPIYKGYAIGIEVDLDEVATTYSGDPYLCYMNIFYQAKSPVMLAPTL